MNKYLRMHYNKLSKDELVDIIDVLQQDLKDYDILLGLRRKRTLINKFDEDYDKEDKKSNPNRTYYRISPDAEEVYRRYYKQKKILRMIRKDVNKELILLSKNKISKCKFMLKRNYKLTDEKNVIDKK